MTSIFIFISGATLLVYSAERLISSLVEISRGLAISGFLLAIIFTGIEFHDIVLGIAPNLEGDQDVALGLVIGTAVSFGGIVLAIGAILTPTTFTVPREYIVVFALSPLIMLVFAIRKEVTTVDAIVLLLLFVAWIAYVAVHESKRETPTFRNLEIIEEAEEQEEQQAMPDPVRTSAVDTMRPVDLERRSFREREIIEEAEEQQQQEPVATQTLHTTSPVHQQDRSFHDLEIVEEAEEHQVQRATSEPVDTQAVDDEPVQAAGALVGLAQPRHGRDRDLRHRHRRGDRQHGGAPVDD